jgi:hypothetical protein
MNTDPESIISQITELHDSLVIDCLDNIKSSSKRLYHYTSLDSATKILKSGKLRFTNALYLNDPAELMGGLKIAEKVVLKMIRDLHSSNQQKCDMLAVLLFRLTVSFVLPKQRKAIAENLLSKLTSFITISTRDFLAEIYAHELMFAYIACLSERQDDLRQWLPYAENGAGIAIGFSPVANSKHSITEDHAIWIIRVCYRADAEKEDYLQRFLSESLNALEKTSRSPDVKAHFIEMMMRLLIGDLISSKSPNYKDEEEWRLFFYHTFAELHADKSKRPDFSIRNGIMRPFHDITLAKYSIEDLKLGPLCEKDLNRDAVTMLASDALDYNTEVSASEVQYRG